MHSSGSTGFEATGLMGPHVADVTFATVTVNSFWELAAPSQAMHVSVQSLFTETPAMEKEHNCKNNQRNKPAILLAATCDTKLACHWSLVPTPYSSVCRVKTKYSSSSPISCK